MGPHAAAKSPADIGATPLLDVEKLNKRTACLFLLATGQRLQSTRPNEVGRISGGGMTGAPYDIPPN